MTEQNNLDHVRSSASKTRLGGSGDLAVADAVNDGFIWMPPDGSGDFYGEAGQDALYLPTLDAGRLRACMTLYDTGLAVRTHLLRRAKFFNERGLLHANGGEVRLDGAKLIFFSARTIQLG